MPFSASKVKSFGVVLKSRSGLKFYSKFYTQNLSQDYSKSQFDVKTEEGIKKFQSALFKKCTKINITKNPDPQKTQIFSLSSFAILFKVVGDLIIFLICDEQQNIVLMQNAINCIGKVLQLLTTEKFDNFTTEQHLDSIVFAIDEIFDDGVILCLDENQVFDRLKMRQGGQKRDTTTTAQNKAAQQQSTSTFNSLFGFAKNTLQKTLNLG